MNRLANVETIPEGEVIETAQGAFVALSRHPVTFIDKPVYEEVSRYSATDFEGRFGFEVPKAAKASALAAILAKAESLGMRDKAGFKARIAWKSEDGRYVEARAR